MLAPAQFIKLLTCPVIPVEVFWYPNLICTSVGVGKKLFNVTASSGGILAIESLAFQPPVGAETLAVTAVLVCGVAIMSHIQYQEY